MPTARTYRVVLPPGAGRPRCLTVSRGFVPVGGVGKGVESLVEHRGKLLRSRWHFDEARTGRGLRPLPHQPQLLKGNRVDEARTGRG